VAGWVTRAERGFADVVLTAAYALLDEATSEHEAMTRPGPLLERIGARVATEHLAGAS
jgi:glycerate 2-kinase